MFCLLFTVPADKKQSQQIRPGGKRQSPLKKAMAWFLVIVWLFLISFAFIAAKEPEWLKQLSTLGRQGESGAMVDYGDNFLRQKNYRMAIAQYQKALKIKPDHTGALVNMAIAYSLSGNHDVGLKVLNDALEQTASQRGTIFFNMADILRRQNKYGEAVAFYGKAVGTEVEQDLVYQRLGTLYFEIDSLEEARQAFEKTLAIQIDPVTPYIKMLNRSQPAFEDDTVHAPVIQRMLSGNLSVDNLKAYDLQSIEIFNGSDPEIAKTHNHLGVIYSRQGDLVKAIRHFEESLKIWPGNIDARKNLPILQQMKNDLVPDKPENEKLS